jgi:hypothetical protein
MMKRLLFFCGLLVAVVVNGQGRDEISVLANTRELHKAVFETKDSSMLEKLFAKNLSYGHSSGRVENRKDAIRGIVNNKSTYTDLVIGSVNVEMSDKTAVARHDMTANEKTADGKTNVLKLHIVLVWTKKKNEWKLVARQAVKLAI